jgi:hypothetical protein
LGILTFVHCGYATLKRSVLSTVAYERRVPYDTQQ